MPTLWLEHSFECPYCATPNVMQAELLQEGVDQFMVDCDTCCRAIVVKTQIAANPENGDFSVDCWVSREID